jgi:ppGpp synthetase/RelA/SpoT-type nucleotidyltranferase/HAMP domain-containing protein
LAILENIQDHADALRRTWLLWAVHFGVTVGIVTLFLAAAIYLQVTRPVNRLVRGVRKMEMGYWGPVEIGGGAWEIRWLAWRFGNMAREVRSSMARLFEAERKARSLMSLCGSAPVPAISRLPAGEDVAASDPTGSLAYRNLEAVCERLEAASPHDPAAVQFARRAWRQDALEANRLGFHQIKARLEDGAFRLMEPDAFADLDGRLAELKASWAEWARQRRNALRQMLEVRAIPCVAVLHRVKHTAGVWSKMHGKGLGIDEVYDLFAFRVVVPTEVDCYAALGVIHHAYQPELSRFKDYIARPKGNGYRSLHTCLKAEDGPVFEVQIRSVAMDRQAERGDAAHWLYKEGGREAPAPRWWDRVRHWAEETLG